MDKLDIFLCGIRQMIYVARRQAVINNSQLASEISSFGVATQPATHPILYLVRLFCVLFMRCQSS